MPPARPPLLTGLKGVCVGAGGGKHAAANIETSGPQHVILLLHPHISVSVLSTRVRIHSAF